MTPAEKLAELRGDKRRRRDVESPIQAKIVETVRLVHPLALIASVENGGYVMAARIVAKLKWRGLKPGFPDLIVTWGDFNGAITTPGVGFLEVKSADGRLSPEQRDVHHALTLQGHKVAVVRSVSEALDVLSEWGVPKGRAS